MDRWTASGALDGTSVTLPWDNGLLIEEWGEIAFLWAVEATRGKTMVKVGGRNVPLALDEGAVVRAWLISQGFSVTD